MADIFSSIANVLGGFLGASSKNKAAKQAAAAEAKANAEALALQKDIFNTNLQLSQPFYQGAGNAFNKLANIYGMPAQSFNYPKPLETIGSAPAFSGSTATPTTKYGAPYAGGIFYNLLNRDDTPALELTAPETPAAPAATTFDATATDPLQAFWDSPYGKLATNQFLTIDSPAIKGSFATAGKALSGAQQKALSDRGAASAGNAFNNYTSGLFNIAGYGPTASSQAQNAGTNLSSSASPILRDNGQISSNYIRERNANWTNAWNNAAETAYKSWN